MLNGNDIAKSIVQWIPPDSKQIIEFGGVANDVESLFRRINPKVNYSRSLEYCNIGYLAASGSVDCIIYDPALFFHPRWHSILHTHRSYLHENGQMLFVIPNARSWRMVKYMLEPEERFDLTQIPFIPLPSALQMLKQAQLIPFDVVGGVIDSNATSRDMFIKQPGFEAYPSWREQAVFDCYIIRSCVKLPDNRLFLHALTGEQNPICARVRVKEPQQFCATLPGLKVHLDHLKADLRRGLNEPNKIFIWQRISPQNFSIQQKLIKLGYLIIAEIDDDPIRWPDVYGNNEYFVFQSSHAVQVSTLALAEDIRQYNSMIKVLPNYISDIMPLQQKDKHSSVTVFFGALNREGEWDKYLPVINKVVAGCGVAIKFLVVHDRRFFDALETKNKIFHPFLPYQKYNELMQQADIGLLILEDSRFNSMKSDIKFLECAANGLAVLASPIVYANTIQEGITGLIYHSLQEFEDKLLELIQNLRLRQTLAKQAYEWVVDNRLLANHYRERLDWYQQLLSHRDELTRDIYTRMAKR